jgi:NitT/TauT family transport system substrate-binding protein
MKKLIKLLSLSLCFALVLSFAACNSNKDDNTNSTPSNSSTAYVGMDMTVACLKGPTGVGMSQLMEKQANNQTANNYTFTVASAPDEISGKFMKGEINIASVPTNLAAKLASKPNSGITMLAVNTLGVLSIIENGDTIKSVADLKGKTIYSTGQGSNPEYILRYVLEKNNIDPDKDVTIQFVKDNDEIIAALVSGNAKVAMVPEPAATTVLTKKDTLKRALSMNTEWEKVADSKLMMGCVVALDSYIEANKAAVDKFLTEYEASIKFANSNIDDAAKLCETYGIVPKAAVAKAAIPTCNVTYVAKDEMKNSIKGYFEVLLSFDKTSIGGKLPADSFYYNAK